METKEVIEKWGLMPEEDIISFFKTNEDNRCKLNFLYSMLVRKERYALAKLFKNKIEILDFLESFKKQQYCQRKIDFEAGFIACCGKTVSEKNIDQYLKTT